MSRNTLATVATVPSQAQAGWTPLRALAPIVEPLLRSRLSCITADRLVVEHDGKRTVHGSDGGLTATLRIHDPAAWARVALRGALGAGEGYTLGEWSSPDLTALVRVMLRNREVMYGLNTGLARLSGPLLGALHAARRNTREGSVDNIAAHYDLSNDFFRMLLDETMTYSSGVYVAGNDDLGDAQLEKLDRLCRMLELGPDDHLLEIGTGWGSMAIYAAQNYGCRVTTTTISKQQHALARERIAAAGLDGRVTLLLQDYRDLQGRYDKLVSVEMIEAVGHHYFDTFFERASALLAPGGLAALQAITIGEADYLRARDTVDFIKAHVFPGSCIPSVSVLLESASRAGGFGLDGLSAHGQDYARTLAAWRHNLEQNRGTVQTLGMGTSQVRAFEYYLAYCEGGFAERHIDVVQMRLSKRRD